MWSLTGAGLGGITAFLTGTKQVVISDYAAPVVLNNIRLSVQKVLLTTMGMTCSIEVHECGARESQSAVKHAPMFNESLAADCLCDAIAAPEHHPLRGALIDSGPHRSCPDRRRVLYRPCEACIVP